MINRTAQPCTTHLPRRTLPNCDYNLIIACVRTVIYPYCVLSTYRCISSYMYQNLVFSKLPWSALLLTSFCRDMPIRSSTIVHSKCLSWVDFPLKNQVCMHFLHFVISLEFCALQTVPPNGIRQLGIDIVT